MADSQNVGTSDVKLCDKNELRRSLMIVNDSTNIVYLMPGRTAVVNQGIRLNASGGFLSDSPDSLGYMFKGEWHAVATGGTTNVTVVEL